MHLKAVAASLVAVLCLGISAASAASTVKTSGVTIKHRQQIKATAKAKREKAIKQKTIVTYFKYLSSDTHKVVKTAARQGDQLDLYTNNSDSAGNPADGAAKPTVITAEEFAAQAPHGAMYLMTNWWCSAAAVHVSYTPTGASPTDLGLYSGDCTNPNAAITGRFYPQKIGTYDPAVPFLFSFRNVDPLDKTIIQKVSTDAGECTVNYYRSLGHPNVYGAQFTCDDGYNYSNYLETPGPNDIQFTVYVFPKNWPDSSNTAAVLKDQMGDPDKDGLTSNIEALIGTNPNKADTDGDGLSDGDEYYAYETSPLVKDTDGDGLSDKAEVDAKSNPIGPGSATADQISRWARLKNYPAPELANISATYSAAASQETVSWSTNVNADGIVNWGTTTAYGSYKSDFVFTKSHAITFTVTPGLTYHYAIRACSTAPNPKCTTTPDATFVAE